VRDDFTKQTIADIAKGVGYRCSNPDCTRPTVAANAAQDGIITIGVAAHIWHHSLPVSQFVRETLTACHGQRTILHPM
jgi:hypothetical protein